MFWKKNGTPVSRPLLLVIVLLFVGCILTAGFAWTHKSVRLAVNGEVREVDTFALTVGQLLQSEKVQVNEHDRVTPARDEFLRDGMRVTVTRAIPVVLVADGTERKVYTTVKTVGDLLDEQGITLGEEDSVSPAREEAVRPGMKIEVTRQRTEIVTEEVLLPNQTIKQSDPSLPVGQKEVVQPGQPGLEKKVWEITYRNGKEYNRRLLASEVIRQPVNRVVKAGANKVISRGGRTVRYSRALEMVATAYTYTGNNTASGVPPRQGVVAVDPRVIPLGTRLYVEGYGFGTALDTGGAIKGNRIDVFMESRAQAYRWGKRKVTVYVLE